MLSEGFPFHRGRAISRRALGIWLAVGVSGAAVASPAGVVVPWRRASLMRARPQRAVLLDVARQGARLLAVGEGGLILLSDDKGRGWRQVRSPVSVTLSGVAMPSAKEAWAVGHAGVVLRSTDGGITWTKVFDGVDVAKMILAQTLQRVGDSDRAADLQELQMARQAVEDGPDKPWLGVRFVSAKEAWIFGAFGMAIRTRDGGGTWESAGHRLTNPRGLHLYALASYGDRMVFAGEQGLLLQSEDGGDSFAAKGSPYTGSFFTAQFDRHGELVIGGLRGNAWKARADGTFEKLTASSPLSISGSVVTDDGRLLFVDQGGRLSEYKSDASALVPIEVPAMPPLSAAVALDAQHLVCVGFGGVRSIDLSSALSSVGKKS